MFSLPVASKPQPFSPQSAEKSSRLRGATVAACRDQGVIKIQK